MFAETGFLGRPSQHPVRHRYVTSDLVRAMATDIATATFAARARPVSTLGRSSARSILAHLPNLPVAWAGRLMLEAEGCLICRTWVREP